MHPNLLNSVEALQSSDSILHILNCINYIVLYFILYLIVLMSHILLYSSEIKIHSKKNSFIHSFTIGSRRGCRWPEAGPGPSVVAGTADLDGRGGENTTTRGSSSCRNSRFTTEGGPSGP